MRHVAFQRESPRRDIASYATTPNHMIACAASSTQVCGMRRHVIPRCGCTLPRTQDTAGTTLWLNRDALRQKNRPRPHSLEGLWAVGCAAVQSFGNAWVQSGGCLHLFSLHIFRKANGTITRIELGYNKIGGRGAAAFAECLKATLVTCVLQVRASLFSWHV